MVSSNNVKITGNGRGGLNVLEPSTGKTSLSVGKVAALRAHFAAERMPEDVQKLVDKARTNILDGFSLDPYGKARRAREARGDLIRRLADALEAAYSQKGAGDDPR